MLIAVQLGSRHCVSILAKLTICIHPPWHSNHAFTTFTQPYHNCLNRGINSSQTCCSVLQEFVEGPFSQNNLDPGASMIIPVPGPTGGLIVVGESVIMYVRAKRSAADQAVKSIQVSTSIVKVSLAGETTAAV